MGAGDKRILITGGSGFLGSRVLDQLEEHELGTILAPRSSDYDLTSTGAIDQLLRDANPDVVIHLAAVVGGIGANRAHPGKFFYENAVMGIELMERARREGVSKFVAVGTVCAYPKNTPVPFREED